VFSLYTVTLARITALTAAFTRRRATAARSTSATFVFLNDKFRNLVPNQKRRRRSISIWLYWRNRNVGNAQFSCAKNFTMRVNDTALIQWRHFTRSRPMMTVLNVVNNIIFKQIVVGYRRQTWLHKTVRSVNAVQRRVKRRYLLFENIHNVG